MYVQSYICKAMWLKRKIKTGTELLLKRMPELFLQLIAGLFSGIKRKAAVYWKKRRRFKSVIRFCDFVISRCNGNRFIEFELSNICNARCVFCPYPDMLKSEKKFMHMSEDVLSGNVLKLSHFGSALISITPTTGDTLLHPEWDKAIGKLLDSPHIARATMFTNAIRLDEENRQNFLKLLLSANGHKLSEIYFSVGGLDADTYKAMYKVDRFEIVCENIALFLKLLSENGLAAGVHLHIKMPAETKADMNKAAALMNPYYYPFVYYSASNLYYSNDRYTRNALVEYRTDVVPDKRKACAYLQKTRFAADGSIWADGCVISEMPGDSSLKLGGFEDSWEAIEKNRENLIVQWEKEGSIPAPCQGCTVYRAR